MSDAAPPPHQDCPTCPECSAPCLTTIGERIPAGHLRCACCGEDTLALPGEVAQALEADRAWLARPD